MVNIFAVGTPTVDNIISVVDNPGLETYLETLGVTPNCKIRINAERADELSNGMSGWNNVVTAPGGSAPNILRAMQQVLQDDFSATLFTLLGNDPKSQMLRQTLAASGIDLKPGITGLSEEMLERLKPSESFVFVFADGRRGILNYPGTITEYIKEDQKEGGANSIVVQPRDIITNDIVMMFGSTRETFGTKIFDDTLRIRWDNHLPLWFSLPTNHKFTEQNKSYFEYLLPSINVLAANSEEVGSLLGQISDTVTKHQQEVIERQLQTSQGVFAKRAKETGSEHTISPIAFVTEGQLGARVFSERGSIALRAAKENQRVNTLGAGDVTTGVFYAGIAHNMRPTAAATLAMTAGAITVEHLAAVPDNLAAELALRDPVNWNAFQMAIRGSKTHSNRFKGTNGNGNGRY